MVLLLTGAGGHIGNGVAKAALSNGQKVIAPYRGSAPPQSAKDLGSGIDWVACDLTDPRSVEKLANSFPIERCIHCAAVPNEAFARPDPLGTIGANITATANLLEQARLKTWERLVLVSTGSVYQRQPVLGETILEDEPPQPRDVYSTTKTAAEMLCQMYRSEYGLSSSVVRISWVYGPPIVAHDLTRGPIPSFLLRVLKEEKIEEGGADFAVSFTFVEDVANGLLSAAHAENLNHPCYHLGPGRNISLGEVAAAIKKSVPTADIALSPGTEPWTRFTALRDPLAGTKLFDDTGWEPRVSIDEGVKRYADWLLTVPELWQQIN